VIELIRLKARTRKGSRQLGPWQIVRELNAEAYKCQAGRLWSGQAVKNILNRGDIPVKRKSQKRTKTQLESTDYLSKEKVSLCRAPAAMRTGFYSRSCWAPDCEPLSYAR